MNLEWFKCDLWPGLIIVNVHLDRTFAVDIIRDFELTLLSFKSVENCHPVQILPYL